MKIRKQFTQEERELARSLRPIDDTFFRTMTKNNIPLVEHIVRVTLDRKDISILEVNTQDDIHIFEHSHSVILDCFAKDKKNTLYNIEVQKVNNKNLEKRVRYYSSLIDSKYSLEKGKPYENIKELIVIFLMEEDYFKKGRQIYEVEKIIKGINLPFEDGRTTIFVNAENKGREELDNLMQSLVARDYREMKDEVIKESTMYYKTTLEGEDQVCEAVQKYAEKSYYKGKNDGINLGRSEGINIGSVQVLLDLVSSGTISFDYAIKKSRLPKKEFLAIASRLGFKV